MNGPARYQKAEEILAELGHHSYSGETATSLGLQALPHATLANAAAAALGEAPAEMRA